MINAWNNEKYGSQDSLDIWGLIQAEVAKGWFIPSINEWAAFGSAFNISNNNAYNLPGMIWSSSLRSNIQIYIMAIYADKADFSDNGVMWARLATTF